MTARATIRVAGAALLALALGCVAPAVDGARRAAPAPGPTDERVRELVERVNAHRRRIGCGRLAWDPRLAEVARRHSADMVRRRYFAHESPEGRSMVDRLRAGSVSWSRAAENLAYGPMDPEEVLEGWRRSPGHRRNLENCDYTRHGIGLVGDYWTHVFVRPR